MRFAEVVDRGRGEQSGHGRHDDIGYPARGLRLSFTEAQRPEAARSLAVLNRRIKPAFAKFGIRGVGWHTFRHTVGSMLAEMGEHQLTIRDRHSNLNVTNKYLHATSQTKRLAQDKLVEAILPAGSLSQSKSTLIHWSGRVRFQRYQVIFCLAPELGFGMER